jgi:putative hydrolase of the HAD superfamily
MSDKQEITKGFVKRLEIDASEFLMVGNSLKSDVFMVLAL